MSDELNRFIAMKVMGWECYGNLYLSDSGKKSHGYATQYNPYHSFADCEVILLKLKEDKWYWLLRDEEDLYAFTLYKDLETSNHGAVTEVADTPTAAIVRCVCKAYGWKEEG